MLNCEYCDYYKNAKGLQGRAHCFCQLTDHIFRLGDMNSDMDYPCSNISYQDYLARKQNQRSMAVFRVRQPIPVGQ